jgi:X-linked retinitis pigmentosa GTPase regulator
VNKIDATYHSACISDQGVLFLWGRGVFGEYPFPQKVISIQGKVVDLSLGKTVSTCVDEQGLIWSWGSNKHGELGLGDQDPRVHPFPVLSLKGKAVTQVSCGDSFVMCLGKDVRKELPGVK